MEKSNINRFIDKIEDFVSSNIDLSFSAKKFFEDSEMSEKEKSEIMDKLDYNFKDSLFSILNLLDVDDVIVVREKVKQKIIELQERIDSLGERETGFKREKLFSTNHCCPSCGSGNIGSSGSTPVSGSWFCRTCGFTRSVAEERRLYEKYYK